MKYEELINLIRSSPSDQNVATALDWLAKRKKCTKSTQRVIETLLACRQDKQTLQWIGEWSRERGWESLGWAAENIETAKIHDWLVEFAIENSSHVEVYKLWFSLLTKYRDKSVIEGSTRWLVEHPTDKGAASIAEMLLDRSAPDEVKSIARKLVIERPEEFFLARVIEYAGNEEIKKIGRKALGTCDLDTGSFIAAALLKVDAEGEWPTIERWLKSHLKRNAPIFSLHNLLIAAPSTVAKFVFEWLDSHPGVTNYDTFLRVPLVLSPSQEYLNFLWSWGKSRVTGKQAAKIFALVLYDPPESLSVPEEALDAADSWVRSHLDSNESGLILVKLMRQRPTEKNLELAQEWLTRHPGVDQGRMLLGLSRLPEKLKFKHQAMAWVSAHPNERVSQPIVLEYIENDSNPESIKIAKALVNSRYVDRDKILIKLIKERDEDGIRLAKQRVTQRSLEFRHRASAKHSCAPIIVALLEVFPHDKDVIAIAEDWLDSEDNCELEGNTCEHISQVRAAFEGLPDRA